MKILSIFALSALLIACANTKQLVEDEVKSEPVMAELGDVTVGSDPLSINNVSIDGNIMTIVVEYSGGCEKHWIDLVGSFSIMKSLPPKRSIKLIHGSNNDHCRELITRTLEFDIGPLAINTTSGSEIMLLLEGYKGEISYVTP